MVWVKKFDKVIGILRGAKAVNLSICVASNQKCLPLETDDGHTWLIGSIP